VPASGEGDPCALVPAPGAGAPAPGAGVPAPGDEVQLLVQCFQLQVLGVHFLLQGF